MYFLYSEHNPPHLHAIYGDDAAAIDIKTGKILDGKLPPKALALVNEWRELHLEELNNIWITQKFLKIEPLR